MLSGNMFGAEQRLSWLGIAFKYSLIDQCVIGRKSKYHLGTVGMDYGLGCWLHAGGQTL
jgi:hypothetical protein